MVVPNKPEPDEENSPALPSPNTSAKSSWAQLLKHVYDIDIKVCPSCGGEMKIVSFITDPCEVNRYLLGTGQSIEAPSLAPARASPTLHLFESECPDELYTQDAAYQDFDEIQHHPDEYR